jgi:hypothetical protein
MICLPWARTAPRAGREKTRILTTGKRLLKGVKG